MSEDTSLTEPDTAGVGLRLYEREGAYIPRVAAEIGRAHV